MNEWKTTINVMVPTIEHRQYINFYAVFRCLILTERLLDIW